MKDREIVDEVGLVDETAVVETETVSDIMLANVVGDEPDAVYTLRELIDQ